MTNTGKLHAHETHQQPAEFAATGTHRRALPEDAYPAIKDVMQQLVSDGRAGLSPAEGLREAMQLYVDAYNTTLITPPDVVYETRRLEVVKVDNFEDQWAVDIDFWTPNNGINQG